MSLPNPAQFARILAAHITSIKDHLEGAVGSTAPWHFRQSSGNFQITLADAAGATQFRVNDSAGSDVFHVDSDGGVTVLSVTPTTLVLPTSATPSQTADGSVAWDSDDDVLTVGTGAATKRLGLTRGAGSSASAAAEMVYDTTAGALKVWNGSASVAVGRPTIAYKTASQVFTTDTTFADITASSGNLAFAIAANEVWRAKFVLPVSFGGTGGVKLQLTGPAAPTLVLIDTLYTSQTVATLTQANDGAGNTEANITASIVTTLRASATAFSSSFLAKSSAGANTDINNGTVIADVLIVNGSTAGTVTLQGAQNSSNSTTTFAAGSWMYAERVA